VNKNKIIYEKNSINPMFLLPEPLNPGRESRIPLMQ
jgi:hypothetical protein